MIRIQEQALISCLYRPFGTIWIKIHWVKNELNQWEPKDLTNWIDKPNVSVYSANTGKLLTSSIYKKQLASLLVISYNTFVAHLDHSKPIMSPGFDQLVHIKTNNGQQKTGWIQGPMINTTAITGIDLTKLPHKLVALLPDKETVYREFMTPRQASWELDGKMECK